MSKSTSPTNPSSTPLPSPPLEGASTEKAVTISETKAAIEEAANDGRLSIRAKDLAPQVIEALATKFGPNKIVQAMEKCINATKTMVVAGRPMEVPDFPTQLAAVKLLLQYQVGMPVARSEVVTHNYDTMQTLEAKMQKSPALRRAVSRMLDRSTDDGSRQVSGKVIEAATDLTEEEFKEAQEELQRPEVQPETPIEAEVRSRSMAETLKVRGNFSVEDKYTR